MEIPHHSSTVPQVENPLLMYSPETRQFQAKLYKRLMQKKLRLKDLDMHMEVLDKDLWFYVCETCNGKVNFLPMSTDLVTAFNTSTFGTSITPEDVQMIAQLIQDGHCSCIGDIQEKADRKVKACRFVHLAASSDEFLPILQHLRTLGCDFEAKVRSVNSRPIHVAVQLSQLKNVKFLVSMGVDVNAADEMGQVPLFLAIHFELEDIFNELLKAPKINVNSMDTRKQPLLINCVRFHPEFIEQLLKAGANPNMPGVNGNTPLMYAVTSHDEELVKMLIRYGADVNMRNDRMEVVLLIVVYRDAVQMVQILLESGADPNFHTHDDQNSLLILASYDGSLEVIKLLLKYGADVTANNKLNYGPVHIAAWNGHLSCVREMIAAGASYDSQTSDFNTPLALAAHGDHLPVIEALLSLGCNVNNRDKDLDTPLLYAAYNGNTRAVDLLIKHGADPNIRNDKHTTVLWNAVYKCNKELVKLLICANVVLECETVGIEQHAQVDHVVPLYASPRSTLWVAVERGAPEIVLLLITAGYNIYTEQWLWDGDFPAKSKDTRLHEMLTQFVHNPPRLMALCRTFIRGQFGLKINETVSQLNLPHFLNDYLTFADLKYSLEESTEEVSMKDSD